MVELGHCVRQCGLLDRVQSGLFRRQSPVAGIQSDEIWVGPGVRAVATAHRLGKAAPLTTVVAPSRLSSVALDGIRLLLGQPLLQRLSSGRFRRRGAEQSAASISVAGVPGVVAIWVERRVLGAVTLEELAHVIASGHVPTSELAALAATWQAANGRSPSTLARVLHVSGRETARAAAPRP